MAWMPGKSVGRYFCVSCSTSLVWNFGTRIMLAPIRMLMFMTVVMP